MKNSVEKIETKRIEQEILLKEIDKQKEIISLLDCKETLNNILIYDSKYTKGIVRKLPKLNLETKKDVLDFALLGNFSLFIPSVVISSAYIPSPILATLSTIGIGLFFVLSTFGIVKSAKNMEEQKKNSYYITEFAKTVLNGTQNYYLENFLDFRAIINEKENLIEQMYSTFDNDGIKKISNINVHNYEVATFIGNINYFLRKNNSSSFYNEKENNYVCIETELEELLNYAIQSHQEIEDSNYNESIVKAYNEVLTAMIEDYVENLHNAIDKYKENKILSYELGYENDYDNYFGKAEQIKAEYELKSGKKLPSSKNKEIQEKLTNNKIDEMNNSNENKNIF